MLEKLIGKIKNGEKKLTAMFGSDYKEYMKKVHRWITRLFG